MLCNLEIHNIQKMSNNKVNYYKFRNKVRLLWYKMNNNKVKKTLLMFNRNKITF